MKLVALDLSLSATGWAIGSAPGSIAWGTLITRKGPDDMARLAEIRDRVLAICEDADLIIMEGLSFGSNDPGAQERTGLAYLIRMPLWQRGSRFVLVAPSTLKKWSTGKGSAPKELVIKEVYKRWGHDVADNNQADAVGLIYLGMAIVGEFQPTIDAQRQVLDALQKANPWLRKFSAEAA